jgi:mannose-1-phosphate guanylyltransferase
VNSIYTTYVYKTNKPKEKGIFVIDELSGKVIEFEEKPVLPKSHLANAGIGVLNKKIFNYFYSTNQDFSKEILPKIIDKIYVFRTDKYIRDIGTLEEYMKAQEEWITLTNS